MNIRKRKFIFKGFNGLCKQEDYARHLIKILGRENPHIETLKTVTNLFIWRDFAEDIIKGTIEALQFRFTIAQSRINEALDFINQVKPPILVIPKKEKPVENNIVIEKTKKPTRTPDAPCELLINNKDRIEALYKINLGINHIADFVGVSYYATQQFIKRNKFKKRSDFSGYNQTIEDCLNVGKTPAEIADLYRLNLDDLLVHLDVNFEIVHGIYLSKNKTVMSKSLLLYLDEIVKQYNDGVMFKDMAEKYNVTKDAIHCFIYTHLIRYKLVSKRKLR